ncbi:cytochrome P450 [Pilobolus umbonatus]|nr:cytochrome P450 [Pilobolus umbonatus]
MDLLSYHTVVLLVLAGCTYLYKTKHQDCLPPTAPGYLPVIGHLLEITKPVAIHELFDKWHKKTGSIFTCYFGKRRWIVLNSMETVQDLIVNKGSVFSSRMLPDSLVKDIMGGDEGGGFAFFPYGNNWRRLRRIAHSGLTKHKIDSYQPILDDRRTVLLKYLWDLSQSKGGVSLQPYFEHYTMTTILSIMFGNMCNFTAEDPVLHEAFQITERASRTIGPSDQIKEFFPIMKWILPTNKEVYKKISDDNASFYGGLYNEYKLRWEKNKDELGNCFMTDIMNSGQLTELEIANFVAIFVGAGSDTTASTLGWIIAFLANHPEIQDKAFAEIEASVGTYRLPAFHDESQLPYLQCIILETLRMRPPAPISIPHSTTEDSLYGPYLIPKDTIVILNLYTINHNPDRYENPHLFNPERHLHPINTQQSQKHTPHLSFSSGRRACVGIHLAERNLFMGLSMILACFKIGRTSEDLINVTDSRDIRAPTLSPKDYKVCLTPRHNHIPSMFNQ